MSTVIKGKNAAKPWTVRYRAGGKQREKSFTTQREAKDFDAALNYDLRTGRFTDPELGRQDFGEACERWLARQPYAERSRLRYGSIIKCHIIPAFSGRTIASVADDYDAVADLLASQAHLSATLRGQTRTVIVKVLDEAVKAGRLSRHRISELAVGTDTTGEKHFDARLFPSLDQVAAIADACGIGVWLMRTCGLRIQEALAVEREDFTLSGRQLNVHRQARWNGSEGVPLKKRTSREYRTVPVPRDVWAMVKDLPDGILTPGTRLKSGPDRGTARPYQHQKMYRDRFMAAAKRAGVDPKVTPHWLRHQYASVLLHEGVPIGDVSQWLGHKNVNTTFSYYRSEMPEAPARAVTVLENEFRLWRGVS